MYNYYQMHLERQSGDGGRKTWMRSCAAVQKALKRNKWMRMKWKRFQFVQCLQLRCGVVRCGWLNVQVENKEEANETNDKWKSEKASGSSQNLNVEKREKTNETVLERGTFIVHCRNASSSHYAMLCILLLSLAVNGLHRRMTWDIMTTTKTICQ